MRIAIMTGGSTGEREVSVWSAQHVLELIAPFADAELFLLPEEWDRFLEAKANIDAVIPMVHGKGAEDGALQERLERLAMPHIFAGVMAHTTGIHKKKTKEIAAALGIPVAPDYAIGDNPFPVFAKPMAGGSTIGARLVHTPQELVQLVQEAGEEMILEMPVRGREFTVGVVEQGGAIQALPVIETISKDGFFDYDSKYTEGKMAQEICPAAIDDDLRGLLQKYATDIHVALGVQNMSRSDFLVDQAGAIFFLEINTIPGFTKMSLMPKALRAAGIDIEGLFKEWLEDALR